jgi:hypothetical protein
VLCHLASLPVLLPLQPVEIGCLCHHRSPPPRAVNTVTSFPVRHVVRAIASRECAVRRAPCKVVHQTPRGMP